VNFIKKSPYNLRINSPKSKQINGREMVSEFFLSHSSLPSKIERHKAVRYHKFNPYNEDRP